MENEDVAKTPDKSLETRIAEGQKRNRARDAVREVVEDHPVAAIAAGIVLGAIAARMLPRLRLGRLGRGAASLAVAGAELATLYGTKAAEKAADAGHVGREKLGDLGESLGETASEARRRSVDLADIALTGAKALGGKTLRQVSDLASRVRH